MRSDVVGGPACASSEEVCVAGSAHGHVTTSRVSVEQELIRRAQAGSAEAYAELVRCHQRLAFHAAWVITRSPHDAEEALQEGLLKAYRGLYRFRLGEPFRPWLLRIVSNEAYTLIRSRSRRSLLQ